MVYNKIKIEIRRVFMSLEKDFARNLISFIDNSPSSFHAVRITKDLLLENGFEELSLKDSWELERGKKYFTSKNDSALVAFTVGYGDLTREGFRIVGAHTDSPGFRIKPNPEMLVANNYLKLNTEVYGGPLLNTWFDRPLSLAGRVTTVGENPLEPESQLLNIDRPILTIPSLAIHMNREANSGFSLNPQIHTLPLVSMINEEFEKENFLIKLIGEELNISSEDILDFELFLYSREKGSLVGLNEEFISVGKLDDLAMVHAGIHSIIDTELGDSFNVVIAFDNEEVGSRTKQGAASPTVKNIMKRIALALNKTEEDYYRALENSFIISADQAHAIHPNFTDKADPTNQPIINKGPVIKMAANQAYTTDSNSAAVYDGICTSAGVPVQRFVNRSDLRGGSTIGPISSSQLPISSVDIGNPILAMHSIRELGGVKDHYYSYKSFVEFFSIEKSHGEDCDCGCQDEVLNKMTMVMDSGEEIDTEIVGIFDIEDESYIALVEEGYEDVMLYKFVEDEGEEVELIDLDDDEFELASEAYIELFVED